MPGIDPMGNEKYWVNGLPFEGVNTPAFDASTEKYWYCGLPADFVFYVGAQAPLGQPATLRKQGRAYRPKAIGT